MPPKTLYEKIWDNHVVHEEPGKPALIYIDRHLVHEGTSPQAFAGLKAEGRKVRRPDLTFAVMDHSVPTVSKQRLLPIVDTDARLQFEALAKNCERAWKRSNRCSLPSPQGRRSACFASSSMASPLENSLW